MAAVKSLTKRSSRDSLANSSDAKTGFSHQTKGYELVFRDISVAVNKKQILKNISGIALPGQMLAIMGPSGAGKTTLLNCLSGRKPIDSGELSLNSRKIDKQLRRRISYVLQGDIFLSQLTCWEQIWYTALLRLPQSMPNSEKKRRVYEIVDCLDMRKCLQTKIGTDFDRGLSGGEKKRTNIACELLTNPALMMLDEPTSGLDSTTAYNLIKTLKEFAENSGKTVVLTIHQPSSQIFHLFDKLLLLCDGEVAYYGDVRHCSSYFSDIGLCCPPTYNLADFVLDIVKDSDETKKLILGRALLQRKESWYPHQLLGSDVDQKFNQSHSQTENEDTGSEGRESEMVEVGITNHGYRDDEKISDMENGNHSEPSTTTDMADYWNPDMVKYNKDYQAKWPSSFGTQFSVLFRRSLKCAVPRTLALEVMLQILIVSVFSGMLWFQTPPTEASLTDRQGIEFFCLTFGSFTGIIQAVLSFPEERPVVNKERLGGYYRLSAYVAAKILSELLIILVIPLILFTIVFWLSGINYDFLVYVKMLGVVMLTVVLAQGIGHMFGALILQVNIALYCSTTTMLCVMLAGGFFIRNTPSWATWMKYLSFVSYAFYTLLEVDMYSKNISCDPVASSYDFCHQHNGTLNDTSLPHIPPEDILDRVTMSRDGLTSWHYIIIMVFLVVAPRLLMYFILRFVRKPRGD